MEPAGGHGAFDELLAAAIERAGRGEAAPPDQLAELERAVGETNDPGERIALGHAYLLLMGPANGAEVAREWIEGDDAYLRDAGFEALVEYGRAAWDTIAVLAASDVRDVRWYGVEAARLIEDPVAVPTLVAALADDDFGIRWAASRGLIAIGEPALIPVLEQLVHTRATPPFHRSVLTTLRRLPAPHAHRKQYGELIASLSHSGTVYTSAPIAEELLLTLRR